MTLSVVEFGSPAWLQAVELRREVLRLPLGMDFSAEELAAEYGQIMVVAENPAVVGVAMMVPQPGGMFKVRQVAVSPDRQGKGLGRALMLRCEEEVRARGGTGIVLHAREVVAPFYLALGFEVDGSRFEEVGIPHLKMAKSLA